MFDWGIHYFDLILYIMNNPNILTVTGDFYSKLECDIANYKNNKFNWGDKANIKGIYDVDDFVCGHIRTDNNVSITFNGAWAQNIKADEEYIDFLCDKGGIRFFYSQRIAVLLNTDKKLVYKKPIFSNANMYNLEMLDFANAIITGNNINSRNNIDLILPTAELLENIYKSDDRKCEINCRKEN